MTPAGGQRGWALRDDMLCRREIGILRALLKSPSLARDLLKAGLRPDLLPSPEGRDLARLRRLVRNVPCPDREEVLAYLALPELGEATGRLGRGQGPFADPSPPGPSGSSDLPPGAALRSLRCVRLPEPGVPSPSSCRIPRHPARD